MFCTLTQTKYIQQLKGVVYSKLPNIPTMKGGVHVRMTSILTQKSTMSTQTVEIQLLKLVQVLLR